MPDERAFAERRHKATAYLTPPQIRFLRDLELDTVKGMVVISTFPDDEIELTWADLDGTLHTRTLDAEGEIKS